MRPDLNKMYDLGFQFFLNGKSPITQHGFKDSTRDRDTLSRMARRYPGCNWGGLRKGTICLDIDPAMAAPSTDSTSTCPTLWSSRPDQGPAPLLPLGRRQGPRQARRR